jgi:hypothetical protein
MGWPREWRARIVRYRITPRGEEALGHLCELEKLIVETGEEGVAWWCEILMHPKSPGTEDIARGETKAI